MAIITDATGRQLAQAVGGIDTTGLVKDSTLQATNTELSNIDITGQSIASAISGLGATLGSDKANIDGSNIVDKSTFRTNIGVIDIFSVGQTYTGNVDNLTTFGLYVVNIAGYGEATLFVLPRVGYTIRCFQIALVYVTSGNIQVIARAQTGASSFSAWRELTN